MSNIQHFHFTLGPVQSFVAQARRTRDFWAGSFLLSWLSGVAMQEVLRQGGEIKFPKANDDFLAWLASGKGDGDAPAQGAIPNRFHATVPKGFKPAEVTDAVQAAWKALADAVWKMDLAGTSADDPDDTEQIWKRQIRTFWDISWVLLDKNDSAALDQRKNWRTYFQPDEPGVKCMMMDGWQELSGALSPTGDEGRRLAAFWEDLRKQGSHALRTDLRPGEHLCAIAYVKRRFVHVFDGFEVIHKGNCLAHGWKLSPSVPSAPFMAAVHWLEDALIAAKTERRTAELFMDFHAKAHELARVNHELGQGGFGELRTNIRCLERVITEDRRWQALDGDLFFDSALDNANIFGDKQHPERHDKLRRLATATKSALRALQQALGGPPPSPFYAVLMMDGDSLGKHMSDSDKQPVITEALDTFTGRVARVVEHHNGFLIYAGGDDVLAVLPLEDAMDCAVALRRAYRDAFEQHIGTAIDAGKLASDHDLQATLSGAIEYAHIRMPLTKVLKDAHKLLDDVAKDARGRDAIAVRVWKPGGKALEWSMPWEKALPTEVAEHLLLTDYRAAQPTGDDQDGQCDDPLVLDLLSRVLPEDEAGDFSSGFFYRIRERFELLNPRRRQTAGDCIPPPPDPHPDNAAKADKPRPVLDPKKGEDVALLAVDYLASVKAGTRSQGPRHHIKTLEQAQAIVAPLLRQCRPVTRDVQQALADWETSDCLEADGALLVRFLAQKGVER